MYYETGKIYRHRVIKSWRFLVLGREKCNHCCLSEDTCKGGLIVIGDRSYNNTCGYDTKGVPHYNELKEEQCENQN